MDDPILLAATAFGLIAIPVLSVMLSKVHLKLVFVLPVLAMLISFPIFFLLVIAQGMPGAMPLFVISMSLWTGGFFGIFISMFIYFSKRGKQHAISHVEQNSIEVDDWEVER